jgi:hypothetical protein
MGNTYNPQSQSSRGFNGLPAPFGGGKHVDPYIVARVRPRTSKGITDLLLLSLLRLDAADPSKKIFRRTPLAEPQRARQDEDQGHRHRFSPKQTILRIGSTPETRKQRGETRGPNPTNSRETERDQPQ